VAVLAALAALALQPAVSVAGAEVIASAGPLGFISVEEDLGCQVQANGDEYPSFAEDGCGTFLALAEGEDVQTDEGRRLFGFSVGAVEAEADFTPVKEQTLTGNGTEAEPFVLTTVVTADEFHDEAEFPVAELVETDSYVTGRDSYTTTITVVNLSHDARLGGTLYHAGECFLADNESGYGAENVPAVGSVACTADPENSPAGRYMAFTPISTSGGISAPDFLEGLDSTVWSNVDGDGTPFPDTVEATTYQDNGMGLSWPISLAGGSSASLSFTTTVSPYSPPAAMFTQCPPVDKNTGCEFLVTVTASGVTVADDSSQGPYDGADDTLVGIQNNSSQAISSIPLSSTDQIFGFDDDGLCDPPEAPRAPGCVVLAENSEHEAPAKQPGTACEVDAAVTENDSEEPCGHEAAGEPVGLTSFGEGATPVGFAANGDAVAGYEGPGVWYSNIAGDATSGVVNFSPALAPGEHGYFALEEALTEGSLDVGSPTAPSPPTSGTPSPGSGVLASQSSTKPLATLATLPPPVLGKSVNVETVSGTVLVALPPTAQASQAGELQASFGGPLDAATQSSIKGLHFIPLVEARQIPVGSVLQTTAGVARIETATAASNKPQFGNFGAGIFKLLQARKQKGLTELDIMDARGPAQVCATLGKRAAVAAKLSGKVVGRLNANAHGKFTTKGQYSAATVRGTVWSVTNQCDGTLTKVQRGVVSVRDFVRRRTITLFTGQHYLARAP
jgi:hypothetical protein